MILEIVVSCVVLAALLAVVGQMLVLVNHQTRLADRRFVARQELENLLEEFTAGSWEEITTSDINEMTLSETAQKKLPSARLSGEVIEQSDPMPSKRITLRLHWQDFSGSPQKPLTLTGWVFRPQEEAS